MRDVGHNPGNAEPKEMTMSKNQYTPEERAEDVSIPAMEAAIDYRLSQSGYGRGCSSCGPGSGAPKKADVPCRTCGKLCAPNIGLCLACQ
jgi:hypothetical protein